MNASLQPIDFSSVQLELRSKWGWFVAIGTILVVLGFLAFGNLVLATTATVFYVGALMILGALASIVHAVQVRAWSGFFAWMISGLLYGVSGLFVFSNPVLAASTLTLVLAIALIVSGAMRLWSGFQTYSPSERGWMMVSGFVTLLAGLVFFIGWPINTLFLLGMLLAFDLTFQGFSAIALGLSLKAS